MKALLSKNRIAEIKKTASGNMVKVCIMAEKYRQYKRQKDKRAKQKPKKYLKSTDYLSREQFATILKYVVSRANKDRQRTQNLTRAIFNEMLIILLAETGLRASEVVNLKLRNLPAYHGKPEIEVESGKGNKDRTVGISEFLVKKLADYMKYHKGHSQDTALFLSERRQPFTYHALYAKIKKIGDNTGIWLNSQGKSRLKPHNFRHTFATLLSDVSNNETLVQSQLGHQNPATTAIYTRTLNQKLRSAMDNFHKSLWESFDAVLSDKT